LSMALSDGHRGARLTAPCLAADFLHFNASAAAGVSINSAVPLSAATSALENSGQPAETECPYSAAARPAGWTPSVPVGAVWRYSTAVAYTDLWTSIARYLDAGRPVVVVMKIDDAFWDPVGGVVEKPLDPPRASHAVLAIAHDAAPSRVLVRNSWGDQWGDEGYAWLSFGYVAARCTAIVTFEGAGP